MDEEDNLDNLAIPKPANTTIPVSRTVAKNQTQKFKVEADSGRSLVYSASKDQLTVKSKAAPYKI